MAGTSTGHASASLVGARITRECTYVPGYMKGDKPINPKIYIPVAINDRRGEVSFFNLTAWGDKITQLFAHYLRKGKEMHFLNLRHSTFRWQMTNKEGQPLLNADGTPLMFDRPSYVVVEFIWGSDSNGIMEADHQLALQEIQAGIRGPNWRTMGHPDNVNWKAREAARVAQPYQGGPTYGYAIVSKRSLAIAATNAYVPAGVAPAEMVAIPPGAGAPPTTIVAPTASIPTVGTVTYESLIAGGWTDAQIMADARYAVLKKAHDTILANNAALIANTVTPAPPPPVAVVVPAPTMVEPAEYVVAPSSF